MNIMDTNWVFKPTCSHVFPVCDKSQWKYLVTETRAKRSVRQMKILRLRQNLIQKSFGEDDFAAKSEFDLEYFR